MNSPWKVSFKKRNKKRQLSFVSLVQWVIRPPGTVLVTIDKYTSSKLCLTFPSLLCFYLLFKSELPIAKLDYISRELLGDIYLYSIS